MEDETSSSFQKETWVKYGQIFFPAKQTVPAITLLCSKLPSVWFAKRFSAEDHVIRIGKDVNAILLRPLHVLQVPGCERN